MNKQKLKLNSEENVRILVDKHYEKLLNSEETAGIFEHLNLEEHLPRVVLFWSFALNLPGASYRGNVFEKHAHLHLTKNHFDKWLQFFFEALDENFEGLEVEQLQFRANAIAFSFMAKLGLLEDKS